MRRDILLLFPLAVAGVVACNDVLPTDQGGAQPSRRHALIGGPVTPIVGGLVTAPIMRIDSQAGIQGDSHVSGDIVCYSDGDAHQVRYYRFSTGATANTGGYDRECSTDGNQIAFIRYTPAGPPEEIRVLNVATASTTIIDPQANARFTTPLVRGSSVGYAQMLFDPVNFQDTSIVKVADLSAPTQPMIIHGAGDLATLGSMSPNGSVLLWGVFNSAGGIDWYKSLRSGATWAAPAALQSGIDLWPQTDGTYVAYNIFNLYEEIYIQDVAGGPISQLVLPAHNTVYAMDGGVIAFVHEDIGVRDIWVYNIATNTVLQVTNGSSSADRPSVSVLSNGNIRVTWTAYSASTDNDVYATTFTPSGGTPGGGGSVTFSGFSGSLKAPPLLNVKQAASTVSVNFSMGGNQGLNIFASGSPSSNPMNCTTFASTGASSPTQSPGGAALSYNATTGLYTYPWKTSATWAGSCRNLTLQFTDGTTKNLYFKF